MRAATGTGSAPRAARSSRSARGSSDRAEGEREGLAGEQSGGSVVINRSPRRQDALTFRAQVRFYHYCLCTCDCRRQKTAPLGAVFGTLSATTQSGCFNLFLGFGAPSAYCVESLHRRLRYSRFRQPLSLTLPTSSPSSPPPRPQRDLFWLHELCPQNGHLFIYPAHHGSRYIQGCVTTL